MEDDCLVEDTVVPDRAELFVEVGILRPGGVGTVVVLGELRSIQVELLVDLDKDDFEEGKQGKPPVAPEGSEVVGSPVAAELEGTLVLAGLDSLEELVVVAVVVVAAAAAAVVVVVVVVAAAVAVVEVLVAAVLSELLVGLEMGAELAELEQQELAVQMPAERMVLCCQKCPFFRSWLESSYTNLMF